MTSETYAIALKMSENNFERNLKSDTYHYLSPFTVSNGCPTIVPAMPPTQPDVKSI